MAIISDNISFYGELIHKLCSSLQISEASQRPPLPQRHMLMPISHVGACRLPEQVRELPHIHFPATHNSPSVSHIISSQGFRVVVVVAVSGAPAIVVAATVLILLWNLSLIIKICITLFCFYITIIYSSIHYLFYRRSNLYPIKQLALTVYSSDISFRCCCAQTIGIRQAHWIY